MHAVATVDAPPPALGGLIDDSGLQPLVMAASKDPNAKATILLFSPADRRRPVLAAKAPKTEPAARAVEAEARTLAALRELRVPLLLETVPRIVEMAEFEGRRALVMTALPGTPMTTPYMRGRHTRSPARVSADFAAVGGWLATVQRETAGEREPVDLDGGVLERLRVRFGDDGRLDAVVGHLAGAYDRLALQTVPRTVVHGDLWIGNVLISGGRVTGVVDWEAGSARGEPLRDVVRFPLMYALYLDRRVRAGRRVPGHPGLRAGAWGAGVAYALDGTGWFPELVRGFIRDGLERLGASPACWRDAAVAGIAEAAAHMDDREFARRQLGLLARLTQTPPALDKETS